MNCWLFYSLLVIHIVHMLLYSSIFYSLHTFHYKIYSYFYQSLPEDIFFIDYRERGMERGGEEKGERGGEGKRGRGGERERWEVREKHWSAASCMSPDWIKPTTFQCMGPCSKPWSHSSQGSLQNFEAFLIMFMVTLIFAWRCIKKEFNSISYFLNTHLK